MFKTNIQKTYIQYRNWHKNICKNTDSMSDVPYINIEQVYIKDIENYKKKNTGNY